MPEADCILAQVVVMLAESPKSVRSYKAWVTIPISTTDVITPHLAEQYGIFGGGASLGIDISVPRSWFVRRRQPIVRFLFTYAMHPRI